MKNIYSIYKILFYNIICDHYLIIVPVLILSILASACQMAFPIAMGDVINDLTIGSASSVDNPWSRLSPLIVAGLLAAILKYLSSILADRLGAGIAETVRRAIHRSVVQAKLSDTRHVPKGEFEALTTEEPEYFARLLSQAIPFFIVQGFLTIAVATSMVMKAEIIAVMTFIPFIGLFLAALSLQARFVTKFHHSGRLLAEVGLFAGETLKGLLTVKVFTWERARQAVFEEKIAHLRITDTEVRTSVSAYHFIVQLVTTMVIVNICGIGIWQSTTQAAHWTAGDVVALGALAGLLFQPLTALVEISSWVPRGFVAAQRIAAFLSLPVEQETAAVEPFCKPPRICCEKLSFGYGPDRMVLKGLDLCVEPGEMVGIAGRSGIGKSTLINLLIGGYQPNDGSILIGDQPLSSMALASWRRSIGLVPQDCMLFEGSILDNVRCGSDWLTDEQVMTAARRARAHDFIMRLPMGYQSHVTQEGKGLSGGERQRLGIARALAAEPPVLIFDEATSALDAETENAILDDICTMAAGCTVLFVSHRSSPLSRAGRVVSLENGRLYPVRSLTAPADLDARQRP